MNADSGFKVRLMASLAVERVQRSKNVRGLTASHTTRLNIQGKHMHIHLVH